MFNKYFSGCRLVLIGLILTSCSNQADKEALEKLKVENEQYKLSIRNQYNNSFKTFKLSGQFTRAELHDCFHLTFRDSKGKDWDLGDAHHHMKIRLFDKDFQLKEKYKNKRFQLTLANLYGPKCDGSDPADRKIRPLPTIVNAKVLKSK